MNAKEASRIWESVFFSLPTGSFFHSHSRFCVTLFFFIEDFESHHGHCVANLSQLFADGGSRGSYFRWPPTRELGFLAETFTDQTRPSIGAILAEKHCSISKVERLLDVQANKQLSECHETRAVTGCPF